MNEQGITSRPGRVPTRTLTRCGQIAAPARRARTVLVQQPTFAELPPRPAARQSPTSPCEGERVIEQPLAPSLTPDDSLLLDHRDRGTRQTTLDAVLRWMDVAWRFPMVKERMLGRFGPENGPPQDWTTNDVFSWLRWPRGALCDIDGVALADIDGRPLYGPHDPLDNPAVGTIQVPTVEAMTLLPDPWLIDHVLVLGNPTSEWIMVGGEHGLVPDGKTVIAHPSGYGVFARVPQHPTNGVFHQHNQTVASETWLINHGGGRYAAGVFVMDQQGTEMRARVTQPDPDQVVVYHLTAQAGKAILTL